MFVMENLSAASLGFLVALCEEYSIDIPADKRDTHRHVLKLTLRHLVSDAIDEAPNKDEIFAKLKGELEVEINQNNEADQVNGEPPNLEQKGGGIPNGLP